MIRKLNEIASKVLELKEENTGEQILRIAYNYANEYINSFKMVVSSHFTSSLELIEDLNKLNSNQFYAWINDQPGFIKAKQLLVKENFVCAKLEDVNSESQEDYIRQYFLEYFCANAICLALSVPNLSDVIVVSKERKQLAKKFEKELTLMSRNFELDAEEQLFLCLLNRLKKSKGSIFNSGKTHPDQMREFMTKRLIQAVYQLINGRLMSSNKIVSIALDINSIFFEQMKPSDAEEHAKKILQYVEQTNHFMQQKVIDLILSRKS